MKKLFCLLLVVLFSCPALANTVDTSKEYAEGEVLVVVAAPVSSDYFVRGVFNENDYLKAISSQAEIFARNRGLKTLNTYPEMARASGKSIIHLRSDNKTTEELVKELSFATDVECVQPNYIKKVNLNPNDSYYPNLWGMINIKMPQVWDYITGNNSVVVAVLDSGIDYNHPDLNANMARDSYGNYGRRFDNGVVSNNPMDTHGHGTHVAGTIGAVGNNGIGVVGVCWTVKMLAVNALPNGSGWTSDIALGMNYIFSEKNSGLNIRVVNMSFGGWSVNEPVFAQALKILDSSNIICVSSAGNEAQDIEKPTGIDINGIPYNGRKPYPACFQFDNTISVGSINSSNGKSSFSNYSRQWIDIAAPGENIYSTTPNNDYGFKQGTSMAAPHVSGAAAILCFAYPNERAYEIKARILSRANKNYGVTNGYWTNGTLDVWNAYQPITSPLVTTHAMLDGMTGVYYYRNLSATGIAPITWSMYSNSLPPGLSLSSSGAISGTPSTTYKQTYTFFVKATNYYGSDIKKLSITIYPALPPTIITSSLPGCSVGIDYYQVLSASGTPSTWSLYSGSLPPGMNLLYGGLIYGTPTVSGTYSFTVKATNGAGSDTKALSIVTNSTALPIITTSSLPDGLAWYPYDTTQLYTSGNPPVTWLISSGSLPQGIEMDSNGLIYGIPEVPGTFNFTVKATNSAGSDMKNFSIEIWW